MSARVCIFVDGENFRHSIVDLFENFSQKDYLPKKADWNKFFDHLVHNAYPQGADIVRVYWYVIEFMDFFPYKLSTRDSELRKFADYLKKRDDYKNELGDMNETELLGRTKEIVQELEIRKEKMLARFDGWRRIHTKISTRFHSITFRASGAIKYDLFEKQLGQEKGVDVKLAIDLILLRDIYDVAIILSGDQDYVSAVRAIKDFGKTVINIAFKTRNGRLLPGGAWRLNRETDWSYNTRYEDAARYLAVDPTS